jgi:hypothetical protein
MELHLIAMVLIGALVIVFLWMRMIRKINDLAYEADMAPAPDWELPPEMPREWTDGIFDWDLRKMRDKDFWVGNVSGKGRDVYVYHKDREKALSGLESALEQLRKEVM